MEFWAMSAGAIAAEQAARARARRKARVFIGVTASLFSVARGDVSAIHLCQEGSANRGDWVNSRGKIASASQQHLGTQRSASLHTLNQQCQLKSPSSNSIHELAKELGKKLEELGQIVNQTYC
jgi:hypothetical protein